MKVNPDRVDLAALAPLPGPLAVNFELTTRCNLACSFCPTSMPLERERVDFRRVDMDVPLFKACIEDLREFPDVRTLYYNGMGESLLHPRFYELVRYAVDAGVAPRHMLRTNGTLLNPDNNQKLVECGLTHVNVSIYPELKKRRGAYERVVDGVRDLFEYHKVHVFAKTIQFEDGEADGFLETFAPITDACELEFPMQWNNGVPDTTGGQGVKLTVNGETLHDHAVCPYPFFTLFVSSRGKVCMCCFDWSNRTAVGDVQQQSLTEIWGGERTREFWKMQLEGRRGENPACKGCTNAYTCPDDLDGARGDILGRL